MCRSIGTRSTLFRVPIDRDEIDATIEGASISLYEGYLKGFGSVRVFEETEFASVIGVSSESEMWRPRLVRGRPFSGDGAGEIILNRNLWKDRPLRLGQIVSVETHHGEEALEVVGIVEEPTIAMTYVYIPIRTAQRLLGAGDAFSGIFACTEGDPQAVVEGLYRAESVAQVSTEDGVNKLADDFFNVQMRSSAAIFCLGATIVAPFILLTSLSLGFIERERDFVIFMTLGLRRRQLLKMLMSESAVLSLLGASLAVPVGILLGFVGNLHASRIFCAVATTVRLDDFHYIAVCLPLFVVVALIFTHRFMGGSPARKLMVRVG